MSEYNSPAAAFSRNSHTQKEDMSDEEPEETDRDVSGATVPEDSPRHPDNKSEAVEKAKEMYKESRPDPQDAENIPDHECDDPDAPWM